MVVSEEVPVHEWYLMLLKPQRLHWYFHFFISLIKKESHCHITPNSFRFRLVLPKSSRNLPVFPPKKKGTCWIFHENPLGFPGLARPPGIQRVDRISWLHQRQAPFTRPKNPEEPVFFLLKKWRFWCVFAICTLHVCTACKQMITYVYKCTRKREGQPLQLTIYFASWNILLKKGPIYVWTFWTCQHPPMGGV